jgi:hypothetical protein
MPENSNDCRLGVDMPADTSGENSDVDNEHPAARLAADCALQEDVCKSLLAMADRLPQSLDQDAVLALSKLIPSTWSAHVTFHHEVVVPLASRHPNCLCDQLELLARQHIEISGANDELLDCLEMTVRGETVDAGMLGYLIRYVAERRRDHVEWEKSLVGPSLPKTLTPAERKIFSEWVAANPQPFEGLDLGRINKTGT